MRQLHNGQGCVLTIPGAPVPKPRMTQRDKWMPSKATQRYLAWKDVIRLMAAPIFKVPYTVPIQLSCHFFIAVPRSLTKLERAERLGGMHTVKPDLKNLIAGLEDALNKVAWADDSQIFSYARSAKFWVPRGDESTTVIVNPIYRDVEREKDINTFSTAYPLRVHQDGAKVAR